MSAQVGGHQWWRLQLLFHMTDCHSNLASLSLERLKRFSQMKSSSPEWLNQVLPLWLNRHTHKIGGASVFESWSWKKKRFTQYKSTFTQSKFRLVRFNQKYVKRILEGFKENPFRDNMKLPQENTKQLVFFPGCIYWSEKVFLCFQTFLPWAGIEIKQF